MPGTHPLYRPPMTEEEKAIVAWKEKHTEEEAKFEQSRKLRRRRLRAMGRDPDQSGSEKDRREEEEMIEILKMQEGDTEWLRRKQ